MKYLKGLLILIMMILLSNNIGEAKMGKKILMIIAFQNFRDEELLIPKKLFEKEGYQVVIASSSLKPAKGMLGALVTPQILIDQVNVDDYDAIVFVGGIGAQEYFHNPVAHKIAREAVVKGKVLGAICLAPRILAEAGVLKGKKATVWQSEGKALEEKGAIYTGKPVEIDGKIVTGAGPFAAEEFAKAILNLLKN
ncbi:DJ-1/PfpI family protein [Thermodesulfobacterium hydrogeniphilum]|uniref:DJ-1/PfpI family protein n=1 Tax=Thermodesulfobacterium hydrogeniphilum TaxID=161156 RepID=UPI000A069B30|nr:DJ-1/PfpI family protein [Thermodesulfobacterium hydrogeniphilum]